MNTTGKIARLPHAIREQLNHRLRDAEPAESLLAWLNARPEVQQILARQFDGRPINPQNLSEWRTGAFADWSLRQEIFSALQPYPPPQSNQIKASLIYHSLTWPLIT